MLLVLFNVQIPERGKPWTADLANIFAREDACKTTTDDYVLHRLASRKVSLLELLSTAPIHVPSPDRLATSIRYLTRCRTEISTYRNLWQRISEHTGLILGASPTDDLDVYERYPCLQPIKTTALEAPFGSSITSFTITSLLSHLLRSAGRAQALILVDKRSERFHCPSQPRGL